MKPLAYPHGERFGQLFGATIGQPDARSSLSFADAVAYQTQTASFDVFGWFRPETYTLTSPGAPQHLQGAAVTTSLAHNLGSSLRWAGGSPMRPPAVLSRGD